MGRMKDFLMYLEDKYPDVANEDLIKRQQLDADVDEYVDVCIDAKKIRDKGGCNDGHK